MTDLGDWPAARPLALGWFALVILVFGFGGWAALVPISGAIIAHGQVDVDKSRQIVQHSEGGLVSDVLIKEGDRVRSGQVLLRLGGAAIKSELTIVEDELAAVTAQRARTEAERDGLAAIVFPDGLMRQAKTIPKVRALIDAQQLQFHTSADRFQTEADQLLLRHGQINSQIQSITSQIKTAKRQKSIIDQELAAQKGLFDQGLVTASQILGIEREAVRLDGILGEYTSSYAEAQSRATDAGLEILRLDSLRQERALAELHDITARQAELIERAQALQSRIDALEIRSPVDGVVMGLQITAPGMVLRAVEPALYVIPQNRAFVVNARIAPTDIDEVSPGQAATLRIAAFDSRRVPDLVGRLLAVSPDTFVDQNHASSYYRAEIEIPAAEIAKLSPAPLVPGMPAEVFLRTRDRTALSYLLEPLFAFFHRALRES